MEYVELVERCVGKHPHSAQLMNFMDRMGNVMTKVHMLPVTATGGGGKAALWRTSFKCSITGKTLARDAPVYVLKIVYPSNNHHCLFQPDITLFFFLYLKLLIGDGEQVQTAARLKANFDPDHVPSPISSCPRTSSESKSKSKKKRKHSHEKEGAHEKVA